MRNWFCLALGLTLCIACPSWALSEVTHNISVEDAWARATPNGAVTGAVYMVVRNAGMTVDHLVGGSTPYAKIVQIHEMTVVDNVMEMRELKDGLPIPAHGAAVLKPGGFHVMLIGLNKPLKNGDTLPLTLFFNVAGHVDVAVPIQNAALHEDAKQNSMPGMK